MKNEKSELEILGLMLTATAPNDVNRIKSITKRVGEVLLIKMVKDNEK